KTIRPALSSGRNAGMLHDLLQPAVVGAADGLGVQRNFAAFRRVVVVHLQVRDESAPVGRAYLPKIHRAVGCPAGGYELRHPALYSSSDSPVISAGCCSPISSSTVGATSASLPPSFNFRAGC